LSPEPSSCSFLSLSSPSFSRSYADYLLCVWAKLACVRLRARMLLTLRCWCFPSAERFRKFWWPL
jgi:hypothetical protein